MSSVARSVIERAVIDLELALANAFQVADSGAAQVLSVARAYLADPWDAIPDDLPNGLDDDLLVLGVAAREVGLPLPAELEARLRDIARRESGLARRATSILRRNADLEAAVASLRADATTVGAKLGWSERDVDGATVAPPAPSTDALTVVVYGRTSCGKTTLVCRLIRELAPAAERVANLLRTSPGAHTTRAPLVLDFVAGPSEMALRWGGAHGAGRHTEPLSRLSGEWFPDDAAWAHVVLPGSSRRLRLVDLPGTHGHGAGAWSFSAQHGLLHADAVVLPMDRRQFRAEELSSLREALAVEPERHLALALRRGPERGDGAAFVERRILDHAFKPDEIKRIRAMPVFEIARRPDWDDEATSLVAWLASLGPNRDKRTYDTLRAAAQLDVEGKPPTRARKARDLMMLLGLMRAIRAAMLHGGDHGGA